MVIKQYIEDGKFIKYYSDAGLIIKKVGTEELYSDAVELSTIEVTYEETVIPIVEDATEEDYKEALREVGVLNEEI